MNQEMLLLPGWPAERRWCAGKKFSRCEIAVSPFSNACTQGKMQRSSGCHLDAPPHVGRRSPAQYAPCPPPPTLSSHTTQSFIHSHPHPARCAGPPCPRRFRWSARAGGGRRRKCGGYPRVQRSLLGTGSCFPPHPCPAAPEGWGERCKAANEGEQCKAVHDRERAAVIHTRMCQLQAGTCNAGEVYGGCIPTWMAREADRPVPRTGSISSTNLRR